MLPSEQRKTPMATRAAAVADAGKQVPPAADDPAEAPAAPKKKKLKLLILAAVPVLLLAVGGGAYVTGMLAPLLGEDSGAAEETPPEPSVFYDIPEMLVNLSSQGKKANFLKIKVSLELADQEAVKALEAVLPRVIDSFQVYLRELRIEDLNGSAGVFRLREELLARVSVAAKPTRIKDVLFREMLVQ